MYPLGAIQSPKDPRDIKLVSVMMSVDLPRKFSRRNQQSPVALQIYGSCVGFTLKSLKEAMYLRHAGNLKILSGRFAYAMCKQNDGWPYSEGTTTPAMLKVGVGVGVCKEEDFPNEPKANHAEYISNIPEEAIQNAFGYRLSGYASIDTIQQLKQAIYQFGECPIMVNVFSDYLSTESNGLIKQPVGPRVGAHEILAIGWDDDLQAIEIKNSWGEGWGDHGFGFLPYIYNKETNFIEANSIVDFIDAAATSGAPIDLAYPVKPVYITQLFGARPSYYAKYGLAGHEGVDFRAKWQSVLAMDSGKVLFVGNKGEYGLCLILGHTWGVSLYAHLSACDLTEGQLVTKKNQVAVSGDSGGVDPHLHVGIKINGVKNPTFKDWINPLPYFEKGKNMELPVYKLAGAENQAVYALVGAYLVPFTSMDVLNDVFPGLDVIELQPEQFAKLTVVPDLPGGKHVGIGIY